MALTPAIFGLRPTSTCLTQIVMAALIHNSQGYCSTRLLSAPLTQQRLALLAAGLDVLALPALLVQPPAVYLTLTPSSGNATGGWGWRSPNTCDALADGMAMMSQPSSTCHPPADAMSTCSATLSFLHLVVGIVLPILGSVSAYQLRPPRGDEEGGPAAGYRKLARLVASADEMLCRLLDGSCLFRVAVLWHLIVLCWWLSKNAAGL